MPHHQQKMHRAVHGVEHLFDVDGPRKLPYTTTTCSSGLSRDPGRSPTRRCRSHPPLRRRKAVNSCCGPHTPALRTNA